MWIFKKQDPEKLVKKYFSFLEKQYGFTYANYCYKSKEIHIILEIGHKTPSVFIARIGEPKFTRLILERIIQYFEGEVLDVDFQSHSLEYNISYIAEVFESYASKIIDHIDEWWIPVQKFQYKLIEKEYIENGQLDDFLYSFKEDYEYLRSKGAI